MPLETPPLTQAAKALYASASVDAVVTGANTRLPMLPADVKTGLSSFAVPARGLPVGGEILLMGTGTIGARLTTPPGFNFVPWVTPAGGAKTDLPGFAVAPLLGTDGTCEVWMALTQLAAGLRVSGYVRYGATNGQAYSIPLNPGGTGLAGALPGVVASDPNVDRTFGVDGFWGAGANNQEYVKCRAVSAVLLMPA